MTDLHTQIRKILALQDSRADYYNRFESAFVNYLNTAPDYDFVPYRTAVADITKSFSNISQEVNDIEAGLRDRSQHLDVADNIRNLQCLEKDKLEMTVHYQLARQDLKDMEDMGTSITSELKRSLHQVQGKIVECMEELRYELEEQTADFIEEPGIVR
eukprot:Colp12_sorted_trinity150504_noHs@27197